MLEGAGRRRPVSCTHLGGLRGWIRYLPELASCPGPDCRERLKPLCFAGSDLRDKERTEGLEKEGSSSKKAEMEHPRSSQETHEKSRLLPLL